MLIGETRRPAFFTRGEGALAHAVEEFNDFLEPRACDALGDEDNTGALIGIWPFVEPSHGVKQMLGALHDSRLARFLAHIHQSFDAQKAGTQILQNSVEQKL